MRELRPIEFDTIREAARIRTCRNLTPEGASRREWSGLPVLLVPPFAREKGMVPESRWLAGESRTWRDRTRPSWSPVVSKYFAGVDRKFLNPKMRGPANRRRRKRLFYRERGIRA